MNEVQEWAAYVARVNEVEAAKAAAKKSSEKPTSALDAEGGDMIQYGAKS
jgi:hypothetical protein